MRSTAMALEPPAIWRRLNSAVLRTLHDGGRSAPAIRSGWSDGSPRDLVYPGGGGMSMITPLFHITLPDDDGEDRHFAPLIPALEGMIAVNLWHIRRAFNRALQGKGIPVPPLYASGVRYREDPPGQENWKDCLAILKDGHGDCDRLVSWRVAELRAQGIPAEPIIKWQQVPKDVMIGLGHPAHMVPENGISMVHVCVGHPGWQQDERLVEDPSKLLGMGGEYTSQV